MNTISNCGVYLKLVYAIQLPTVYVLAPSRHELLSVFPSSHLSDNVSCLSSFSRLSVSICHWFHCVAYFCTLSSNSALYLEVQVKIPWIILLTVLKANIDRITSYQNCQAFRKNKYLDTEEIKQTHKSHNNFVSTVLSTRLVLINLTFKNCASYI
jgi:hypothetical protein